MKKLLLFFCLTFIVINTKAQIEKKIDAKKLYDYADSILNDYRFGSSNGSNHVVSDSLLIKNINSAFNNVVFSNSNIVSNANAFMVVVTAINTYGASRSDTLDYFIRTTQPSANFEPNRTFACTGQGITFENTSEGVGLSYNWDFGNGDAPLGLGDMSEEDGAIAGTKRER